MLFFAPIAFFSTMTFAMLQIYYLPFAFYYTIVNKRRLDDWSKQNTHKLPDTRNGRSHWLFFMLFGWPKMMYRCVADTCKFFMHLFVTVGEEAVADNDRIKYLSLCDFEIVEGIIEQFHKNREYKTPFRNLVKRLQEELGLFKLLQQQLFFTSKNVKQGSNTRIEWETIHKKLNTYNLCKQVFHVRSTPAEVDKIV
jgi:hypothetical protein